MSDARVKVVFHATREQARALAAQARSQGLSRSAMICALVCPDSPCYCPDGPHNKGTCSRCRARTALADEKQP